MNEKALLEKLINLKWEKINIHNIYRANDIPKDLFPIYMNYKDFMEIHKYSIVDETHLHLTYFLYQKTNNRLAMPHLDMIKIILNKTNLHQLWDRIRAENE